MTKKELIAVVAECYKEISSDLLPPKYANKTDVAINEIAEYYADRLLAYLTKEVKAEAKYRKQ